MEETLAHGELPTSRQQGTLLAGAGGPAFPEQAEPKALDLGEEQIEPLDRALNAGRVEPGAAHDQPLASAPDDWQSDLTAKP